MSGRWKSTSFWNWTAWNWTGGTRTRSELARASLVKSKMKDASLTEQTVFTISKQFTRSCLMELIVPTSTNTQHIFIWMSTPCFNSANDYVTDAMDGPVVLTLARLFGRSNNGKSWHVIPTSRRWWQGLLIPQWLFSSFKNHQIADTCIGNTV